MPCSRLIFSVEYLLPNYIIWETVELALHVALRSVYRKLAGCNL